MPHSSRSTGSTKEISAKDKELLDEFLDEFPLTVTGKVQKFKLRDMGVEKFGLEQAARTKTA